jgi:phenylpyruvate tautomerase
MPYFKVTTNVVIQEPRMSKFLEDMHQLVVNELAKPEKYIMVAVDEQIAMQFGGSNAPLAFVEFKSIGLSDTKKLSTAICDLLRLKLNIPVDRTYIEFMDEPRDKFGYNRTTFE